MQTPPIQSHQNTGTKTKALQDIFLATLNVRGLGGYKKECIAKDMESYKVDICALQETKAPAEDCWIDPNYRIITFDHETPARGVGFVFGQKLVPFLHRAWRAPESERIAYAVFRIPLAKKGNFEIRAINGYGITSPDAAAHPDERTKFYEIISKELDKFKSSRGITILLGDFNAKVGPRKPGEHCIGKHSVGTRNTNGVALAAFAEEHHIILTNTCFKHSARHKTTWTGQDRNGKRIFNQIDFIGIPLSAKSCLRNARAYAGITTNTDHKMVKAHLQLKGIRAIWQRSSKSTPQENIRFCVDRMDEQKVQFCTALEKELQKAELSMHRPTMSHLAAQSLPTSHSTPSPASFGNFTSATPSALMSPPCGAKRERCPHFALPQIWQPPHKRSSRSPTTPTAVAPQPADASPSTMLQRQDPQVVLQALRTALCNAAQETLGMKTRRSTRWFDDPIIADLSTKQKALRLRINNEKDKDRREVLKKQRAVLLRQIHKTILSKIRARLDNLAQEVEEQKDHAKVFVATRQLRLLRPTTIVVHDEEGHELRQNQQKAQMLVQHFAKALSRSTNSVELPPFEGPPMPFINPISEVEVGLAINKLRKRRAPGADCVAAEMIQAASAQVAPILANCYNDALQQHIPISLGHGIIIPFPKPGKPKGPPGNLRPVTLLSVMRKVLANVVVERSRARFEQRLPPSQAGARASRSTTDGVFIKMMLVAIISHYDVHIFGLGTDLTQAFDKVNRAKLLTLLKEGGWMGPDEIRITRYLLADTTIQVRVGNSLSSTSRTSAGTFQGDSLSMMLFVAYLAGAQWDVQALIRNHIPKLDKQVEIPLESAYVDDVDNHSFKKDFLEIVLNSTQQAYTNWDLSLNLAKTERTDFYMAPPTSKCPKCSSKCTVQACCCDQCGFWWHNACALISPSQFASFVANPTQTWYCPMCEAGAAPAQRGQEPWRSTKHLGIRLDATFETARRIQKAGWAYAALQKLWIRRDIVSECRRIRLFKAFVLPHFLYGLGALPLTSVLESRLDAAHRRLLRRLIRMAWPNKITNKVLYERTLSIPISEKAREMRWQYLGHILRRTEERHPAAQAFRCFFKCRDVFRATGHFQSDLIATLRRDLKQTEAIHGHELKDLSDVKVLEELAKDKKEWGRLTQEICARF